MGRFTRYLFDYFLITVVLIAAANVAHSDDSGTAETLRSEISEKGWILFAGHPAEINAGSTINDAKELGQLDLYWVRPDGSQLRRLTATNEFNEFGGRVLPDDRRILYRRTPKNQLVNHDLWGSHGQLVIAKLDGSDPQIQGDTGEYPWASFSPDCKHIACLYKKEKKVRIFDFVSKRQLKEIPCQGMFQQMFWSPDGQRLVGTANLSGRRWNIVSVELKTGQMTLLSRALNCTPDWFQNDSQRVIYSNRNPALFRGQGDDYGLTVLMQATVDGKQRKLIYGNAGKHCYYGSTSPDDLYVVFADNPHDSFVAGEMRVLRLADTPIVPKALKILKMLHPRSNEGPVFSLHMKTGRPLRGFEPHWTFAPIETQ